MSFTKLVALSVVPALLLLGGLTARGDDGVVVAVVGGIAQAFILARFFDKRRGRAPPG